MPSKMSVTPLEKFIFEPITEKRHVTEQLDTSDNSPKHLIVRISIKKMSIKSPEYDKKRMLQIICLCVFVISFEFFC